MGGVGQHLNVYCEEFHQTLSGKPDTCPRLVQQNTLRSRREVKQYYLRNGESSKKMCTAPNLLLPESLRRNENLTHALTPPRGLDI